MDPQKKPTSVLVANCAQRAKPKACLLTEKFFGPDPIQTELRELGLIMDKGKQGAMVVSGRTPVKPQTVGLTSIAVSKLAGGTTYIACHFAKEANGRQSAFEELVQLIDENSTDGHKGVIVGGDFNISPATGVEFLSKEMEGKPKIENLHVAAPTSLDKQFLLSTAGSGCLDWVIFVPPAGVPADEFCTGIEMPDNHQVTGRKRIQPSDSDPLMLYIPATREDWEVDFVSQDGKDVFDHCPAIYKFNFGPEGEEEGPDAPSGSKAPGSKNDTPDSETEKDTAELELEIQEKAGRREKLLEEIEGLDADLERLSAALSARRERERKEGPNEE